MGTALETERARWLGYHPDSRIKKRIAEESVEERRALALRLAERASFLLRESYGARRVVAFGSLARAEGFSRWSDIDLAAWGIPREEFFSAVAAVTGLSPTFRIDLIEGDRCGEAIRGAIEEHGVEI